MNRPIRRSPAGRQSGYSNGATLTDLASYLISKGAKYAINLDGGGSTTMVVRQPGQEAPKLANRPSEGSERRVSATLQVINSAPAGTLKAFSLPTSLIGSAFFLRIPALATSNMHNVMQISPFLISST